MVEARWLEVWFKTDGELAEALAETLSLFVVNGVVMESDLRYDDAHKKGVPSGTVRVYGYIPVDEQLEETRQRLSEALWHMSRIQPIPEPAFRPIVEQNWMEAWKEHCHPIEIGERLLVLPTWVEKSSPGRVALRLDPSMAFGSGSHPTTRLCLEMVEKYLPPASPVIDLGCGSGILSIAALLLGAGWALGVDIDAQALDVARDNAERNGVLDRFECGWGSLAEIRSGAFSIQKAPLVLANILAPVILNLVAEGLPEILSSGGVLVLSGILEEQAAEVEATAVRLGLKKLERLQQEDWVALALRA